MSTKDCSEQVNYTTLLNQFKDQVRNWTKEEKDKFISNGVGITAKVYASLFKSIAGKLEELNLPPGTKFHPNPPFNEVMVGNSVCIGYIRCPYEDVKELIK